MRPLVCPDETFRTLQAKRPELSADRLARTRTLMNNAVRDCLVTGYEGLIAGLRLPDSDDAHVLAEGATLQVLHEQAAALRNPPRTLEDLVSTLEGCGLTRSMARVRALLGGG